MKRSAAIKLIEDTHTENMTGNEFLSFYQAEKILEALEAAGMLPPRTELKNMPGTFDNAWDSELNYDTTDPDFIPF